MKKLKIILYKEENNKTTKGYRITMTTCGGQTTITEYIDFIDYGLCKVCQFKTNINIDYLINSRLTAGYRYL
ncbi:MAG: hypothetical protein IKY67_06720 [Paludibacteraceae bacterium]|nr:hypothetical protein [Paludibacteraceae bacterium]